MIIQPVSYTHLDLEEIYLKLKGIHHPNLTTVYDVLYCDGNTYIVEENIDEMCIRDSSEGRLLS